MKPLLLLIYYGWLSSFNHDTNQWSLQLVADDFSQSEPSFRLLVVEIAYKRPNGEYLYKMRSSTELHEETEVDRAEPLIQVDW